MTLKEKIDYYSLMHKQNLNGRETEDELFEAGISVGIQEADDYAIGFAKWSRENHIKYTVLGNVDSYKELLEIYKKTL